jgi:UDP-GlcNAc:undecaprenyl-phosphate/decaprenyl-phosphate GlcNAc-1-phosphate transferase
MILYFYVSIFLTGLAASLLLTPWVCEMAHAVGLVVPPASQRHLHTGALPRLGGMAICIGFSIAIALSLPLGRLVHVVFPVSLLLGILLPALLVFCLGVYDDLRTVTAKTKIAVQSVAAAALYSAGCRVHYFDALLGGHLLAKTVNLVLTIFVVLLITNAYNLIDGLDGLAAGSALISAVALFVISLSLHNTLVAIVVTALAGALLGFLPSNFFPASIFMGDSGSLFVGFLLSAGALSGTHPSSSITSAAILLLVFGLPLLDVTLAIARRAIRGRSPLQPDADHIHHKLLKRGFTQNRAAVTLYLITAIFGIASLILVWHSNWTIPTLIVTALAICVGVRQLQYREFFRFLGTWLPQLWPNPARSVTPQPDRARIMYATESLRYSPDLRSVCMILRQALYPLGFEGLRLDLEEVQIPASALYPLEYESRGSLIFIWSKTRAEDKPDVLLPEVELSYRPGVGLLSLIRALAPGESSLDNENVLSQDFRLALSDAVWRGIKRAKSTLHPMNGMPTSRTLATDSSPQ